MQHELLNDYRKFAVEHGDATIAGNSTATNKAFDQLHGTLKALCEMGADDGLLSLFGDENPSVRLWAAAHSLEVDEKKSLAALTDIATAGLPIISMSARYTAQGWKNGELRVRQSM